MSPTVHASASTLSSRSRRPDPLSASSGWPLGSLLLSLLCFSAHATPPASTSTSPAMPAAVQVCAACHGVGGAGNASGIPRIAGMNADYLAHTLGAFKAGSRHSDTMQPIARTLSDADIDSLAKYFAAQQPPTAPSPNPPSPDMVAAGKRMAMQGDNNSIPACFSCHAMNGSGNGERYPGIAGEPAAYVVNRLHEFQAHARASTPKPGSMTEVASKLTDAQIRDVAAYLSVIPPK
jgi:cytochrome c553